MLTAPKHTHSEQAGPPGITRGVRNLTRKKQGQTCQGQVRKSAPGGRGTTRKSARATFQHVPDSSPTAGQAAGTHLLCILPLSFVVCGCSSGRPSGERVSHWARRCCSRLYSRSSARRVPGEGGGVRKCSDFLSEAAESQIFPRNLPRVLLLLHYREPEVSRNFASCILLCELWINQSPRDH